MPCIFAKKNSRFRDTDKDHPVIIGKLTDIIVSDDVIMFTFDAFEAFQQTVINENIEEQIIILDSNEMINRITIWLCEQFRGFEVITNKNKKQRFGWCEEGQECKKIDLDEFYQNNNYLVGFFGSFHKIEGILNMGFYYVKEKSFYLFSFLGLFSLRVKLKNEEFKKNIFNNIEKITNVFFKIKKELKFFEIYIKSQWYEYFKNKSLYLDFLLIKYRTNNAPENYNKKFKLFVGMKLDMEASLFIRDEIEDHIDIIIKK